MAKQLVVVYPPTFDGELHIAAQREKVGFNGAIKFEFTYASKSGEDEWDALVRAARDILAQEERRAK